MRVKPIGQTDTNVTGWERLFRTKRLDAMQQDIDMPESQLRRVLGPLQLTLLGIGAIIGAGIFATIGTAAAGDLSRPTLRDRGLDHRLGSHHRVCRG
ncbi:MAG: hypothetical protein HYZ72_00335 [Deltaproteobacteria bacterium]|nr:hypothetical protein [Deltaproteobacteria bacterium]